MSTVEPLLYTTHTRMCTTQTHIIHMHKYVEPLVVYIYYTHCSHTKQFITFSSHFSECPTILLILSDGLCMIVAPKG